MTTDVPSAFSSRSLHHLITSGINYLVCKSTGRRRGFTSQAAGADASLSSVRRARSHWGFVLYTVGLGGRRRRRSNFHRDGLCESRRRGRRFFG